MKQLFRVVPKSKNYVWIAEQLERTLNKHMIYGELERSSVPMWRSQWTSMASHIVVTNFLDFVQQEVNKPDPLYTWFKQQEPMDPELIMDEGF